MSSRLVNNACRYQSFFKKITGEGLWTPLPLGVFHTPKPLKLNPGCTRDKLRRQAKIRSNELIWFVQLNHL